MILAFGMLTAVSCSEFDDYNKEIADAAPTGNQTLWENIQQNAQLSDFRDLVKKTGFDKELSQTQYYTVWAPLNDTFDPSAFTSLSNDALMRQFVKNHIASYGHQALGKIQERVLMLNEKTYDFVGNSPYLFDGVTLAQTNLPCNNGVLHTLNGLASFYPNLYEFVIDSTLNKGKDIDSLRNYFKRYEQTELDKEHSVLGSIVNGMQTYVDSVMITNNTLWNSLNVKMNNEDSTYTFIMPTNKAWRNLYNTVKSNYKYIADTKAQGFSDNKILTQPLSIKMDNNYWQDSIANRYLTRYLSYSNTSPYNKKLADEHPSFTATDSLYSTTRNKLSNPTEILSYTVEKLKMSNGFAYIVDSLAMHPWETYAPERFINANNNVARVTGAANNNKPVPVEVGNIDPTKVDLSEQSSNTYRYLWVQPSSNFTKAELDVYLPDVLSTTYDFYCIFVPQNVDKEKADIVTLPNRVIFTLNYCDEKGTLKDYVFLDQDPDRLKWFKDKYETATFKDNATNSNTFHAFTNDTSKVDTLYLGEFTFPVCYLGLGDEYCPNIKITTPFLQTNTVMMASFTRDIRIAGFILKPKELVEFENKNKK